MFVAYRSLLISKRARPVESAFLGVNDLIHFFSIAVSGVIVAKLELLARK